MDQAIICRFFSVVYSSSAFIKLIIPRGLVLRLSRNEEQSPINTSAKTLTLISYQRKKL